MQSASVQGNSRTRLRSSKRAAAIVIMLDAITRISRLLFDGARPIDRTVLGVDVLVLLVILVDSIRTRSRERRADQRERQRDQRLAVVQHVMSKGHELEQDAPYPTSPSDAISRWKDLVNAWIRDTQALLKSYSAQAEASFLHDPHTIPPNYRLPVREYHLLVTRLNNLRGIMENSEVYL